VFKWKPDHLAAAPLFESAATSYKAAEEYKMAKLLFVQAADSNEKIDAFASSALCLIKAVEVCKVSSKCYTYLLSKCTLFLKKTTHN
jgi:hypothetical protein